MTDFRVVREDKFKVGDQVWLEFPDGEKLPAEVVKVEHSETGGPTNYIAQFIHPHDDEPSPLVHTASDMRLMSAIDQLGELADD